MKIHDVEQQSREWMQLHVGIPTAGGLDNLLTPEFELRKGEMAKSYIYKKAAEAWRGKPMIDLGGSFIMEQGLILESEAIPFWELMTGRKVTRVGFISTDDGLFGCSPDGVIMSEQVGIEIKAPSPGYHVKYLSEGVVPKEYRVQVQSSMFATGWKQWIFFSYCRGFPPLILQVFPDDKQQSAIAKAVESFHSGLDIAKRHIERWEKNPLNEIK